jgi:hypothetical protein
MSLWFPPYFWWAILEPIGECHVAVRQIKRIVPSHLRCYRILLRKHQTHDLTKLDIIQEELDVYRIRRIFSRSIGLIVDEVVLGYHLDIGVFDIDRYWSSESNSDRSISGKERPPNTFPESLVGFAEL